MVNIVHDTIAKEQQRLLREGAHHSPSEAKQTMLSHNGLQQSRGIKCQNIPSDSYVDIDCPVCLLSLVEVKFNRHLILKFIIS